MAPVIVGPKMVMDVFAETNIFEGLSEIMTPKHVNGQSTIATPNVSLDRSRYEAQIGHNNSWVRGTKNVHETKTD